MSFQISCRHVSECCDNGDVALLSSWTGCLLAHLQQDPQAGAEHAIKQCSVTHYDALGMDGILEPFCGRPQAFYQFLHDEWNWIVTQDADGNGLIADENKDACVCALVRCGVTSSPNLCNCSEGFAERMFSKVLGRPVQARVTQSILRGGKHCVYHISWGVD